MMRIHRLLEKVQLEDAQIRKVEKLLKTRLPSVTDSDFEAQAKLVEEAVWTFKAWFVEREPDPKFVEAFKLYTMPCLNEDKIKQVPDDEYLLVRILGWPASARISATVSVDEE